jgi:hypothetical protein
MGSSAQSVPEPTAAKSRASQSMLEIGARPHDRPDKSGAIILDHQHENALVETDTATVDPSGRTCAGKRRVEPARQPAVARHAERVRDEMSQDGDRKFGSEGERTHRRRGRDRSILRTEGRPARCIAKKAAARPINRQDRLSRPLACREPPTICAIALEPLGVSEGVFALHDRRSPAVLEVVAIAFANEFVPDAAKIDPDG